MQNKIKPFVKWAGGKGSLLSQLNAFYPIELKKGKIECYIEPFIGGGAVLIDILQNYKVKEAYAFDINLELINSYNVIKNNVEELITNLKLIEKEYLALEIEERKEYYYNIRNQYNSYKLTQSEISLQKAVEFIFLNRTCFNGLYRVNRNGEFNVPIGNYKKPTICDEENLRELSKLIKNVNFKYGDYKTSREYIKRNTFVYFDPPYRPLNITSGFTSYTKDDFNDENQKELALFYKELNSDDVKLMLSNSNPKNTNKEDKFFDNIYQGFNISEIYANRMINANAQARGKISEILITNYDNRENKMKKVKEYEDGSFLEYGEGRFDNWCVYYTDDKGKKTAPKDKDYFKDLYDFSRKYGNKKMYLDYVKIYNETNSYIEEKTISHIELISRGYETMDITKIDKIFTILYMGMIAEENKENTILGKRIKRLGIHALLVENKSIEESATFMTGKKWQELDKMCLERGF